PERALDDGARHEAGPDPGAAGAPVADAGEREAAPPRATPPDAGGRARGRDPSRSEAVPVALLLPRAAAHVVPVLLPDTRVILARELDSLGPLRALPEVEVRDHDPHGCAVLRGQGSAVVTRGEKVLVAVEVLQGDVGRPAAEGVLDDEARLGLGARD